MARFEGTEELSSGLKGLFLKEGLSMSLECRVDRCGQLPIWEVECAKYSALQKCRESLALSFFLLLRGRK